ncbi:MAG: hypothetical protein PVJ09_01725 [Candidatus Woesebacteria bacterium]|jgi:hypothetical protein
MSLKHIRTIRPPTSAKTATPVANKTQAYQSQIDQLSKERQRLKIAEAHASPEIKKTLSQRGESIERRIGNLQDKVKNNFY